MSRYWDDHLQHYASPYYDPQKAHEYYEQHKHLKGRSTKGMTKQQKETWKITKANINAEKKEVKKATNESRSQEIKGLQDACNKAKAEITAKIKAKVEEINKKASSDLEDISKKNEQLVNKRKNLTKLADLPANASEATILATRKRLEKENEKITKDQKKLDKDAGTVRTKSSEETKKTSESGESEKTALSTNLKGAIESVRAKYKSKLESIDAEYEGKLDSEFAKIKSGK